VCLHGLHACAAAREPKTALAKGFQRLAGDCLRLCDLATSHDSSSPLPIVGAIGESPNQVKTMINI
jgi:hypothetical protein